MTDRLPDGSLVLLKSGGPLLTVERGLSSPPLVSCVWYDGVSFARDTFHRDALVVVWRPLDSDAMILETLRNP